MSVSVNIFLLSKDKLTGMSYAGRHHVTKPSPKTLQRPVKIRFSDFVKSYSSSNSMNLTVVVRSQ